MRYSLQWLRDYVAITDSPEEIGERATAIGFAVEAIDRTEEDVVFDLEVNPNRVDCMNHLGLARELAAAYGTDLERPSIDWSPTVEDAQASDASVKIEDELGCPRYVAVVVRDVEVGPSPEWIRRRLEAVGVRPINNVVDITNYVLWELGQPLHAFDLDRLASPTIVVRRAQPGEHLVTLDGEGRELAEEVLVIADESRAVALAGIMGGATTEVTRETTSVLIESAHFAPTVVRAGAKKLAMHTDASHRFERGSDSEICLVAALRAAELMAQLAGGKLPESVVDCRRERPWEASGTLDLAKLEQFAGTPVPRPLVETTFPALGFELTARGESAWQVAVPSWRRFDLEVDADGAVYSAHLYEEALRFFGYDRVPSTLPSVGGPDEGSSADHELREQIRRHLSAAGLAETITYGFYGPAEDGRFLGLVATESPIKLSNALSERYSLMRRSLLPNVVEGARFNQNRSVEAVRLFEIGHVFPGDGVEEREALAIVVGGTTGTPWSRSVELDFFDLKGVVQELAESASVELEFEAAELRGFVSGATATIRVAGEEGIRGYLGRVDDSDATFALYAAELDVTVLDTRAVSRVEAPSRFPGVSVDLTLTHSLAVEWAAISDAVTKEKPEDLLEFGLKDRYRGSGVPSGAVNTTLYFLYNSAERSLTKEEVNDRHERLAEVLRERFGTEG